MIMQGLEQPSAVLINADGACDVLLVCEHASNFIPDCFANLGLSEAQRLSHVGWDIGAAELARALSDSLDAALLVQRYSRLLYDCNRPPSEASAIPQLSEETQIKGNLGLSVEAREYRVKRIYEPFHNAISAQIAERKAAGRNTIVVSIHSFTAVYLGRQRAVQLGIIFDTDNAFAAAFYQQARKNKAYDIRINEPYGPSDPVLHLVTRHTEEHQVAGMMLEIRNDLLLTAAGIAQWTRLIADTLNSFKN